MRYITVEDLSFLLEKMEPPRRLLSRPVLVFYNQDMAKLPFQRPTLVGQN